MINVSQGYNETHVLLYLDLDQFKVINDMGKRTIAEFVENDAIRNKVAELGIDFVQGYGINKPIPFKEVLSR